MAKLGLAPVVSGSTARLIAIGELTAGTTTALEQAVSELLDEGVTELTIDLRQAEPADVEAIDALLHVAGRACERGVAVRLCADDETRGRLEEAKTAGLFAAIDKALARAESVRSLLDVCEVDDGVPSVEAVTWITTDEPPVPAP